MPEQLAPPREAQGKAVMTEDRLREAAAIARRQVEACRPPSPTSVFGTSPIDFLREFQTLGRLKKGRG